MLVFRKILRTYLMDGPFVAHSITVLWKWFLGEQVRKNFQAGELNNTDVSSDINKEKDVKTKHGITDQNSINAAWLSSLLTFTKFGNLL